MCVVLGSPFLFLIGSVLPLDLASLAGVLRAIARVLGPLLGAVAYLFVAAHTLVVAVLTGAASLAVGAAVAVQSGLRRLFAPLAELLPGWLVRDPLLFVLPMTFLGAVIAAAYVSVYRSPGRGALPASGGGARGARDRRGYLGARPGRWAAASPAPASACPICADPLDAGVVRCGGCETLHHADCVRFNGDRCSTFGCAP